ncbi:hypothetical protein NC651_021436 [Populus alba x Populus x berolinensis]|nr:hypothetical protein NC651_021436 [Populus alba x Populus x berolinensis]
MNFHVVVITIQFLVITSRCLLSNLILFFYFYILIYSSSFTDLNIRVFLVFMRNWFFKNNPSHDKQRSTFINPHILSKMFLILHQIQNEVIYRGWKVMPFIIGNETFEKLGTIGTLSNLLIYLTTVFNMKSITAATVITVFNGTANLGTLIGAFLCDTYFGRYKTLGFATVASFLGLLAIQLTAAISKLHPPHCAKESSTCIGPTGGQIAFLLAGFILMIIGAGGIRPCNLAFGADQFNPETESGKRGVNSFFNWYFFTFTFAQMISLTLIVYVQSNVSWPIGLGIPAILMLISCVKKYIYFLAPTVALQRHLRLFQNHMFWQKLFGSHHYQ